jgi:hypothetical protein
MSRNVGLARMGNVALEKIADPRVKRDVEDD